MRKLLNSLVILLFLFTILGVVNTETLAQGTFKCVKITPPQSKFGVAYCKTTDKTCTGDFSAAFPDGNTCEDFAGSNCPTDTTFNCTDNKLICETGNMRCDFIDTCLSPCQKVVVKGGGASGRGAPYPGVCACLLDDPADNGTVPEGGNCLFDSDCVPTAPYCWAERFQLPTCHTNPKTDQDTPAELQAKKICKFASEEERGQCEDCVMNKSGIWTPFGCISTNIQDFVRQLLTLAISIGGGIAFIMIVLGGFNVLTSAGNPERLTSGKEIITSAIAGLLLIVFSIIILKIIGVDILKIPGLSK